MCEEAYPALEVAMSLIPEHDKLDFLKVLAVAPDLIFKESSPSKFLRFTNFNPSAAALALARYWKGRREIFGTEAFLPLSLAGGGALDDSIVDTIRSGISLSPTIDRNGRTLLFYDASRHLEDNAASPIKYLFYLHQFIMENDMSQTEGYVLVAFLTSMEAYRIAAGAVTATMTLFPIKIKAWHFLSWAFPGSRNVALFTQLQRFVMEVYPRLFRGHVVYFHERNDRLEIAKCLEVHGIDRSMLPLILGGSWSYWNIHEWVENRIRRDKKLYGNPTSSQKIEQANKFSLLPSRYPLKKRIKTMESQVIADSDQYKGSWTESHTMPISSIQQQVLAKSYRQWRIFHGKEDWNDTFVETSITGFFHRHLDSVIRSMHSHESAQYSKAASSIPVSIWENECNPFLFLLTEDFHVPRAAERLARYWNLRSDIFQECKFMPLNQTGEGALKRRSDLAVLSTGFVYLLPHDEEGCSVVCIDTTCLTSSHKTDRQNRCLFYMFSLTAENWRSQERGISVLIRISSIEKSLLGGADVAFMERLVDCFPINIKAIHLIFDSTEPPVSIKDELNLGDSVHIHHNTSKDELLVILASHGFSKDHLPRFANGTWGSSQFNQWQELRTRVEWSIPLGLSSRDIIDFPGIKSVDIIQDKIERERRLSIIHAWRKRARSRNQQSILEDQVADLHVENTRLHQEKERLERITNQAQAIAKSLN